MKVFKNKKLTRAVNPYNLIVKNIFIQQSN